MRGRGVLTGQKGLTLLEVVLVVILVSVLGFYALNRFYKVIVDIERAAMEEVVGALENAISLEISDCYTSGDMQKLAGLVGRNPMDLLDKKPANYLGVISLYRLEDIEKGSWYYDSRSQLLIYMVRNQLYFESVLEEPKRARFKIVPTHSGSHKKKKTTNVSWLKLEVQEAYRWLRPWG